MPPNVKIKKDVDAFIFFNAIQSHLEINLATAELRALTGGEPRTHSHFINT